jgi:hypothetical protein
MEIFGGIAFAEDIVVLTVMGFGQFLKHALAIRGRQNVQEGNAVQPLRKDGAGLLTW